MDASEYDVKVLDAGVPSLDMHHQLAELAFEYLGMPTRIAYLPCLTRKLCIKLCTLANFMS
jgi:hypothetical protein